MPLTSIDERPVPVCAGTGRLPLVAQGITKHYGGNIYYVYKLGATVGQGLYHLGAQMRGQSYEDFLATRNARGAR